MQPLSRKQKDLAYRWLVHGGMRIVARPLYRSLMAVELRLHREAERLQPKQPHPIDVTALIKTFERPHRCRELVASIRRIYPKLPIIVVDDSRQPEAIAGVTTKILPYDSGVSAGRQAGLELVKTKYVINLDDDHRFCTGTDLHKSLTVLEASDEIDLIGGKVVDLPLYISHDLRHASLYATPKASLVPVGTWIAGLEVYDKVPSFFVARTESVARIGWDRELKRLDHADFFTRAKGELVTVCNPAMEILHVRDPFDAAYLSSRLDLARDLERLDAKYF